MRHIVHGRRASKKWSYRVAIVLAVVAIAMLAGSCALPPGGGPVAVSDPGRVVPLDWNMSLLPTEPNVQYGPHDKNLGDIYLPTKGGNRGVVIMLHGGGFNSHSDARSEARKSLGLVMSQVERGFAVFNITYRGVDTGSMFPDAVRDLDAAVKWVRENGLDHSKNPKTIVTVGHSAGGTIAALGALGSNSDKRPLNKTASVDGWVSVAGILDGNSGTWYKDFIGIWPGPNPIWRSSAAPTTYLDPEDPPGYLIHGDMDNVVPVSQMTAFVDVARRKGIGDRLHYDRVQKDPAVPCRWHSPTCGANADAFDGWIDKVANKAI